jgi:hypothetical protein
MRNAMPSRNDVTLDTPLRLSVAAAIAFPDGSMTASGLRREGARGRLVIERIAGKDYTTLANIDRMRELCRVEAKVPVSGCARPNTIDRESSRTPLSGSSKMADTARARDAALMMIEGLKRPSLSTSRESTLPKPKAGSVHRPRSRSGMS